MCGSSPDVPPAGRSACIFTRMRFTDLCGRVEQPDRSSSTFKNASYGRWEAHKKTLECVLAIVDDLHENSESRLLDTPASPLEPHSCHNSRIVRETSRSRQSAPG